MKDKVSNKSDVVFCESDSSDTLMLFAEISYPSISNSLMVKGKFGKSLVNLYMKNCL